MNPVGIAVREVTFYYTEREIIFRRCSFEVAPGATCALVGPNGSGKSSLLLLIAGFYQPISGQIVYYTGSQIITTMRPHMAIATPLLDFPPTLSVEEVVRLHHALKPVRWDLWSVLWKQSALAPHRHKRIGYLSSGLYQRLRLLLAFGTDAPLLLLDEPTSYLDADGRDFYHAMLQEWRQARTVIIASNDPDEYVPYAQSQVTLLGTKA